MKIAIDISSVIYGTGVSVYTRNLVKNLLKFDKSNEYVLFGGSLRRKRELSDFISTLKGNFKPKIFRIPPTLADIAWNRFRFIKIEYLTGKIDVFHSSDWTQPPTDAYKVTTVHDLIPIKYPELSHPRLVSVQGRRLKHIKREVDTIIVPSKVTKEDLIGLGVKGSRIVVIPEAPESLYKHSSRERIERLKRKYRIKGKYLLAVGVTPRKNVERIIETFENVKAGMNLKLVIVGEPKVRLEQKRGVIFTGHVPNDEMPVFYSGSEALVYPSLYEGFGLPILDAFACKTAVVTSNFGSMKEVAGKAAILVDPYKVDSIKQGILKALENRTDIVTMGLKRLEKFSWEITARKTLDVYNRINKRNK